MKTYAGKRTMDGLVVTVDGKPLDEHYEVKRFAKYGFEWTYEGESPHSRWPFCSTILATRSAPSACRGHS